MALVPGSSAPLRPGRQERAAGRYGASDNFRLTHYPRSTGYRDCGVFRDSRRRYRFDRGAAGESDAPGGRAGNGSNKAQNDNTDREVILPSPDFDATLAFFRDTLGFRLDAIHPADDPAIASLSGYGLRLRLDRDAEGPPPALRIASADPATLLGGAHAVTAPNGATVTVVEADPPLDLPPLDQKLTICRTDGANGGWGVGRAGMLYRDLIPEREGGRFIASHIRIPDGGPVPDNVHFHKIRFQMIYNYKGWVRLVYEDQGEPFVMGPGDCVLQPPEIRHRVLECSDGLEVIEIGSPAEHMTLLDHDLPLPTGRHLPERDYGGQRFVLHRAEGARWAPADMAGFEARDLGIAQATGGLAEVEVLRQDGCNGYRCGRAAWRRIPVPLRAGRPADLDGRRPRAGRPGGGRQLHAARRHALPDRVGIGAAGDAEGPDTVAQSAGHRSGTAGAADIASCEVG